MIVHQNSNYATNVIYKNLIEELVQLKSTPKKEYLISAPVRTKENIGNYSFDHPDVTFYYQNIIKKYHRVLYHQKISKMKKELLKRVVPNDIELIHAVFQFTDGGVGNELFKKYNIPYIISIKNTDLNIFYYYLLHLRNYGNEIIKNAAKVVFLTPCYRDKLINTYLPKSLHSELLQKSIIIPNGIDEFWHNNLGTPKKLISKKTINIANVGEISKLKNLNTLLSVADKLIKKGYEVSIDIAGKPRGKYGEQMIKKIKSLSFCNYHGVVKDKNKLKNIFKSADIFILPSKKESFGLVYAEALSQATPIIYVKGEGFDGQFPEGTVGYSCDPDSVEDIILKIQMIQDNYELLSKNCIEKVSKFKWSTVAANYESIYQEVLS